MTTETIDIPRCLISPDIATSFQPVRVADPETWINDNCPFYNINATPYWRGLLQDLVNYQSISVLKSAQIGYTSLQNLMIAYFASTDPATAILALPTKDGGEDVIRNTLVPTLQEIRGLTIRDHRKNEIKFAHSTLHLASLANSKTLKSRSARYIFTDEIDEAEKNVQGEGDPLAMLEARTIRYTRNRKMLFGSTPRHANGHISRLWNSANDRRTYHVACPHCGKFQTLKFDQLKWRERRENESHSQLAGWIEAHPESVYYECEHCSARLTETDKQIIIAQGVWLSETQRIDESGNVVGNRPPGSKVAYRINSLYSTWFSWSRLAVTWLNSCDDPNQRKSFLSQYLGELPVAREVSPDVTSSGETLAQVERNEAIASNRPAGVVPGWAGLVTMGVDRQGDRFYYSVRAWGRVRSQLLLEGVTGSEDTLIAILNRQFPIAGCNQTLGISKMVIDFGGTTTGDGSTAKAKVFKFARRDSRILPIKGHGNTRAALFDVDNDPTFNSQRMVVCQPKALDELFELRTNKLWFLHSSVSQSYIDSLDGCRRMIQPDGSTSWSMSDRVDWLDTEVYQYALSRWLLSQNSLPDEIELENRRKNPAPQQRISAQSIAQQILPGPRRRW